MSKEPKLKSKKKLIVIIIVLVIGVYLFAQKDYISSITTMISSEAGSLEHVKDIIELDISQYNEVIVNKDQVVLVTRDGVKAVSLEGEEVWADTHTLKNIDVSQSSPYFAIGDKMGYEISIYDDKGKSADIQFENPIGFFSLNNLGDLVAIEKTPEGHIVSAYNAKGDSLGIKRVTYIEDAGYPMTAAISPDGEMILVSYLDANGVVVDSNIVGIILSSDLVDVEENILYGRSYEDTLVSHIEFISKDTWVLVGDNLLSFNKASGEEISSFKSNIKYAPVITRGNLKQKMIYANIAGADSERKESTVEDQMHFYNQQGEEVFSLPLEKRSTYAYNDGKTVIVGSNRDFIGFNAAGKKNWTYKSSKDVEKIIQLYSSKQVIIVSKGKVELMNMVR